MSQTFKPFSTETEVLRVGEFDIENRLDRVTLTGDVVLTKDQAGLALAREFQALLMGIVQALEAEKTLPEAVALKASRTVKNPFA